MITVIFLSYLASFLSYDAVLVKNRNLFLHLIFNIIDWNDSFNFWISINYLGSEVFREADSLFLLELHCICCVFLSNLLLSIF